jgi:flavin reductase (DIM6/NTAB) family NADH-FMN oxidoreductase RutF
VQAILGQLSARAAVVGVGASGAAAILAVGQSASPLVSALVLIGATAWVEAEVASRIVEAMALRSGSFPDAASALAAVASAYPLEPMPTASDKLLSAFEIGPDGAYSWRCDHRILHGIDLKSDSARLEMACARIAVPTALIRGSLNASVSTETTLRLQALIPGSEFAEIDGVGHFVATDREDAFNAILLDFLERNAPRRPIQCESGSDPRLLRDALGCFGTGVTVVTTFDAAGNPIGLTANSFTSVSIDPPLILFCLAKTSASLSTFLAADGFAINVLHIGQQPTSSRFAQRHASRFEGTAWDRHPNSGSPCITGSLASFDCRRRAVHDAGDHVVFIGEVRHAIFEPHRDPLVFFRGKYRRLHFT